MTNFPSVPLAFTPVLIYRLPLRYKSSTSSNGPCCMKCHFALSSGVFLKTIYWAVLSTINFFLNDNEYIQIHSFKHKKHV